MSSSIKTEENELLASLENGKFLFNSTSGSGTTILFETFIPEQINSNESLHFDQPHNLYFQSQFPQTNSAASGSNSPLSIYIAHTYDDNRLLHHIERILQTINYQEKNLGWQFGEIALDTRWEMSRYDYLESVDLILLLVTRAFVATNYCSMFALLERG